MNSQQHSVQVFSTKWGEFGTLEELFGFFLHKTGMTRELFGEIITESKLDAMIVCESFTLWVKSILPEQFGTPTVGGKTITLRDNEIYLIVKYFFEIVNYDPEKVYLVLNKHNAGSILRNLTDVGIGTIMLFHALKK